MIVKGANNFGDDEEYKVHITGMDLKKEQEEDEEEVDRDKE